MQPQSLRARLKETVAGTILDAAEEVAAQVGPTETSIQAVAQRAGVSVGTIYNYFTDRNELFAEVFARRRAELLAHLDAARGPASGFAAQLETFVRTVFAYFDTRRAFLRLAVDHPQHKGGEKSRTTLQQLTVRAERIVAAGVKEGKLRDDGGDLLAAFLVAAIKTVIAARAASPEPLAGETERVVSLFLNGARGGGHR